MASFVQAFASTGMAMDKALLQANELVERNKSQQALIILRDLLARFPSDLTTHADVVGILCLGRMYEEAKSVISEFEKRTNQAWKSEPGIADIESEQAEYEEAQRTSLVEKVHAFSRLKFSQRGHFTNLPIFFYVESISISNEGIGLKKRFHSPCRFTWDKVSIRLIRREAYKSYGKAARVKYIQRICVVNAGRDKFIFDVSLGQPDFSPPELIIELLRKYSAINEEPIQRKSIRRWWTTFEWF